MKLSDASRRCDSVTVVEGSSLAEMDICVEGEKLPDRVNSADARNVNEGRVPPDA